MWFEKSKTEVILAPKFDTVFHKVVHRDYTGIGVREYDKWEEMRTSRREVALPDQTLVECFHKSDVYGQYPQWYSKNDLRFPVSR